MMKINVLRKGDEVMQATDEYIVVKRKKGEVDIIPIIKEGKCWRVDTEGIVTIGFGENTVTYEEEEGIRITNF